MQIEAKGRKKELAEIERESKKGNRERILAEREANPHLSYGLGQNSLLIRVNTQTINKWITMKYVQFSCTLKMLTNNHSIYSIFIECIGQRCMDRKSF